MAKTAKLKQLAPVRVDEEFSAEVAEYTDKAKIDQAELVRRALREYMDNNPLKEK